MFRRVGLLFVQKEVSYYGDFGSKIRCRGLPSCKTLVMSSNHVRIKECHRIHKRNSDVLGRQIQVSFFGGVNTLQVAGLLLFINIAVLLFILKNELVVFSSYRGYIAHSYIGIKKSHHTCKIHKDS